MIQFKKALFWTLFFLGFLINPAFGQKIPKLELYYGETCPHCENERKWLPELKKQYPDLVIEEREVWNNAENAALWEKRLQALGQKAEGVPTNIIENEVIVGFKKEELLKLLEKNYGPGLIPTPEVVTELEDSWWQKLLNFFKGFFE